MRIYSRFAFLFILTLNVVVSHSQDNKLFLKYSETRNLMASPFTIVIYTQDTTGISVNTDQVFHRLEKALDAINYYDADSEINEFCHQQKAGNWVKVSVDLLGILKRSKRAYKKSDGVFDVSAGRLIRFWKSKKVWDHPVDSAIIKSLKPSLSLNKLRFRGNRVKWGVDSVVIDIGGIGKGYVTDLALKSLRKYKYKRVLINAGGDMVLGREKPTGPWAIGVEMPGHTSLSNQSLALSHRAVATSGTTYQTIEIDGKIYSHIINPVTGLPVSHHSNVTTIAKCGWKADFYASYFSILEPEEAIAVANKSPDVEVLITFDKAGGVASIFSRGFSKYLKK
ncbi:FAD:protein FMN transferase [Membranihabitans marinus]|uniref:FAD:protein FMN transferase n=1 Tax=Membranihabitans marinus TaxID=1227546 RepID=UPI001F2C2844|nr:FAD:protein FMN transferase [Membranihabitans marinus]